MLRVKFGISVKNRELFLVACVINYDIMRQFQTWEIT